MICSKSLLGSLLLLFFIASISTSSAQSSLSTANNNQHFNFERQTRSFPYSVSFYRMLGHDRQLQPYYGVNDEVAALIDSMNSDELMGQPRARRSDGIKGYACRFKFCRIYDS